MKFTVNAGVFAESLLPNIEVATKNIEKDFYGAEKITFHAEKDKLTAFSHGGKMALILSISNDTVNELSYDCKGEGKATILAINFDKTLKAIPPSAKLDVDATTSKMILSYIDATTKDKHKERQTIVFEDEEVKPPVLAKKFKQEVKINREMFIGGLNKVKFAIGWAQTMPYYMVELFEIEEGKARFAAGTGARFAVLDIEGKCIEGLKEKQTFYFPKDSIDNMIKVLSTSSSTDVSIKYAPSNSKSQKTPDQIIIDFEEGKNLILLGLDSSINYPALDNVINFDYPHRISSELDDWKYVVAGIDATYSPDIKAENDIHNTDVTARFDKEYFLVETRSKMEAERTVKFGDIVETSDTGDSPSFRCGTNYLKEIYDAGGKIGKIIIQFEDKSNDGKKLRPVFVEFQEKENDSKGTTEKFKMFFAVSKR
ncbi:hypothetical protein LCGC14_1980480 [marine sediment metagenome]|uniref:Uncharacterized protein n=1 Tax=marine sediment metagenome TaxID=412755 RepID=A0A0F9HME5_9ZZZZ